MSMEENFAEADADHVDRLIAGVESAAQVWKTRDGQEVRIGDMTDSHLVNTIRMLERMAKRMEQDAIDTGYAVLGSMNGEVAQQAIESDLHHLETEGADVEEFFPIYTHLTREADGRGLRW